MRFGRRRSSLAADPVQTEPEARRRNRLSKPLTSNATKIQTSTSAPALSLQVPGQSKNASTTELPASPLSSIAGTALRQHIRNDVLAREDDSHSPTRTAKHDSSWRVAYMVSRIEGKKPPAEIHQKRPQQQQLESVPLSPVRPQKRKSSLLRRLSLQRQPSLSRTPSYERVNSLRSETAVANTPTPSLDQIAESPSIPPTRRASFAPGTATRKASPIKSKQDIQVHKFKELEDPAARVVDLDYLDWQPPPPRTVGRAGTPSDMGYSQLGGLRHGSLQIVNGRASPAVSEASKVSRQLLANHPPHRDVSSEYGDTEEEVEQFDLTSIHGNRTVPAERRIFSWEKDDDEVVPRTHPLQTVMSPEEETTTVNHISRMANEYIAELPASPYEQRRQSSPVGSIRRARSESSLWRASSCASLQRSPPIEKGLSELSPGSPSQPSLSPTGSVIRKTSFETVRGRGRRVLQVTTDHKHHASDSTSSWYSPVEPAIPADEAFQSALEFQVQLSPSKDGLKPFRAPEKSDSGYSSGNSLRSLQIAKRTPPPPVELEASPQVSNSSMDAATPQSGQPTSFLVTRPSILKLRKTEPNVPTFANSRPNVVSVEPAVAAMETAVPGPAADGPRPSKARKKLMKKRRPVSQSPGQISVVKVQSFEVESIPQVSPAARENLRIRSQTVPELQRTYMTSDIMGNTPSESQLDLSNTEFRFPSPGPVQSLQVKRSRSRSRPRSWFERSKTDTSNSRGDSGISRAQANAIIDHFGTDGAGLGRSPYDLSSHGVVSQPPGTVPVNSAAPFQSRSMMDDRTAADLSRRRSRSLREREYTVPERRLSFNDRGGIPGKNLRPASFFSEAPPITAEMLEKAYRTSSMQRQPSWSTDLAPPPPPHSSRPSYLDYDEDESDPVAPPPPPHSPRPIDITADPWIAEAAAWKARRKSAGEGLRRQAWDYQEYEGYPESSDNELLYPVIPPGQQADLEQYLSPEKFSSSPQEYHRENRRSSLHHQVFRSAYEPLNAEPNEHEPAYVRQSREHFMTHDTHYPRMTQSEEPSRHRPLPQPRPANGAVSPRPHSRANSARSFASSIAEELHPRHLERQHPPPAFGRYSGGLAFGYEHGSGFGGSAGTRSSSGQAGASRKGVFLRASHGVDLGDVPVGIMARQ
ncbi:hypothetical protein G647_01291 [Cladophialophora carrionii CBS 160.54]|uniref:Uncharacterized protein n=1 Tax=Cladophialophora carrionii CBS 160.54 TaxID=1279043 RepID=V9DPK7_9EURO|nr:uncharacterized protein G647_01291 [Cladophialophora carrionii CBS 160.54]ETI28839.1 hypothetical protein G647_01291 [Cladophialophora carrionii CBS 160.54]